MSESLICREERVAIAIFLEVGVRIKFWPVGLVCYSSPLPKVSLSGASMKMTLSSIPINRKTR